MMKTLAIAAVTTALMAAAPAQAIEAMNALTANAVSSNALTANAISSNALALRGSPVDGRIQVIAIELAEPIRAE
jgi:hypothetical protein